MRFLRFSSVLGAAFAVTLFVGATSAVAAFHGIGMTKGCTSPTKIGAPYTCSVQILNVADTGHDTVRVTGLSDVVNSAGGSVSSGDILATTGLIFDGAVSCSGGSGAGTAADPYLGASECLLPFGTSITTEQFSHYTVQPGDFNLLNNRLTDTASVNWNNTCVSNPDLDCTTLPQVASAGSSALVQKLPSSAATVIHNAAHQPVTAVETGTTVHDFVTVTGQAGQPKPSGKVTLDWFQNGTCSGSPALTFVPISLDANGQVDLTMLPLTPSVGFRGFVAHYSGDAVYLPSDGPCEPLRVVDANIQITPNGVNRIGKTHTFTAHVNVHDGNGWANAPAGTGITLSKLSGPGSFTPASGTCVTVGTTGSCTVDLSSSTTGVTTVRASTAVAVAGVTLNRATGDGKASDSADATKRWVNAKIAIAPDATNEVGQSHTFTVTLMKDTGNGAGFVAAAGEHVAFSLINANGATHSAATGSCVNAGVNTDANGQCTITFTSNTAGTVTGFATATLSVSGSAAFAVSTGGGAPNSAVAVKTFVDANIQITPATATNPVSTNHTLTGHVNVNAGHGAGYVNAPNDTLITFSLQNAGGASASFVGPDNCKTSNDTGSCTVVINSSTTGTTTIHATATLSVGGVSLTRATGDAKAGDSADATKRWADDTVRTDILNASDAVITTAVPGDVVHDRVEVAKTGGTPAGVPNPTGNVVFHRYSTIDCSGTAVDETVALTPGSPSTAVTSGFTVQGDLSYKANYNGDANYPAQDGACEQLSTTLPCPAGGFTGTTQQNGDFTIVYDQFPAPNDNSYGVNAVGWPNGHTFSNLTGSDKSGYEVVHNGTVVLDFYIDYLSAKTGTPSGYASLGPFGGDGRVNVGTLTTNDLTWDTSLARNLNNLGYFAGGVQNPATINTTNGTNLLVNSPATLNTTDSYVLKTPNPWTGSTTYQENGRTVNGWDFHDTFFVTLKASKLIAIGAEDPITHQLNPGWSIQPDLLGLHNSPAKPCPAAPPGPAQLSVTGKTASSKTVSITIADTGSSDAVLTQLSSLAWPQATNGNLVAIKLGGNTLYNNSTGIASPQSVVGIPPLTSDVTKRTITHAKSEVLQLTFKNNVDTNLTHYTGTASFTNAPDLTLLP